MITKNNNNDSGLSAPSRGTGAVFLIGFMGSGKSYWGRRLGQHLHVPFYDLDDQIEQSEGRSINRIFEEEGEEYFRQKEKEVLMLLAETHSSFIMATGGGTPCFFNNIDYMNRKGITIWINCSVECLQRRLWAGKEKRPLIKNFNEEELKAYITKKIKDRRIFYQQASEIIYEAELSLDAFLNRIFKTEKNN